MREEGVEIDVEIKVVSELAILINDGYVEAWIPLSLIGNTEEFKKGMETTIIIPEWIAIEKELV